jgi:AraC-like DNA-binding protein
MRTATEIAKPGFSDSTSTIPIGTVANLPLLIGQSGRDGWEFMERYGLSAASFVRPLQPVPIELCAELIHQATRLTGNDDLPMMLGAMARMENLGPLRMLVDSCRNVREAIGALMRFGRLWYSPFQITMNEGGGVATISISVKGSYLGHQEIRTSYLTAMVNNMANIVGTNWKLKQISFSRPLPGNPNPYRRHFGVLPMFGRIRDEFSFDAKLLAHKRKAARGEEAFDFLRQQMVSMEEALGSSFAEQISDLIESLLVGGCCNAEKAAGILGISSVTLYRRLKADGATFEKLLDAKRRELAEAMLQRRSIPVQEIADALCYSSASNFIRAFCRWTGKPPEQWRRSLHSFER